MLADYDFKLKTCMHAVAIIAVQNSICATHWLAVSF